MVANLFSAAFLAIAALSSLGDATTHRTYNLIKAATQPQMRKNFAHGQATAAKAAGVNLYTGSVTTKKSSLPARSAPLGGQRVEMTYGPFLTEGMMSDTQGMGDFMQEQFKLPCTDCYITFVQADLQFMNGTSANANRDMWLHHMLLIDIDRPDTICGRDYYARGNRWFASGNERTPFDLTYSGKVPVGYYISANPFQVMVMETMNQGMKNATTQLVIDWEYIPAAKVPKGFSDLTSAWLDVTGCDGFADFDPPYPRSTTPFTKSMSPPWKSTVSGAILAAGAHLHDGGMYLNITRNKKTICESEALYAKNKAYVSPNGFKHISNMTYCVAPGAIAKNDSFNIEAHYDFKTHPGMKDSDGTWSEVMGIAIQFMVPGWTTEKLQGYIKPKKTTPKA